MIHTSFKDWVAERKLQQDEMSLRTIGNTALQMGADMAFGPEAGVQSHQVVQAVKGAGQAVGHMAASAYNRFRGYGGMPGQQQHMMPQQRQMQRKMQRKR